MSPLSVSLSQKRFSERPEYLIRVCSTALEQVAPYEAPVGSSSNTLYFSLLNLLKIIIKGTKGGLVAPFMLFMLLHL